MSVFAALRRYLARIETRRRYHRTERMIESLPPEVLKDIGWPGSAEGIEAAAGRVRG